MNEAVAQTPTNAPAPDDGVTPATPPSGQAPATPAPAAPPASAQPAPAQGDNLLSTTGDDGSTPAGDWPSDWRNIAAGGDKELAKALERVKSPLDLAKGWNERGVHISKTRTAPTLPDNATPEQLAAYRKDAGIPDKPEGYLEKLSDGLVIGEADKELTSTFLQAAHEANLDPKSVDTALQWYTKMAEGKLQEEAKADATFRQETAAALRAEWGGEYDGNYLAAKGLLDAMGNDAEGNPLGDALMAARLPNGRLLGDSPEITKWLVGLADQLNPAGVIIPSQGKTQLMTVNDEIASIENTMRTNREQYNRDSAMQKRYVDLLDHREKLSQKG